MLPSVHIMTSIVSVPCMQAAWQGAEQCVHFNAVDILTLIGQDSTCHFKDFLLRRSRHHLFFYSNLFLQSSMLTGSIFRTCLASDSRGPWGQPSACGHNVGYLWPTSTCAGVHIIGTQIINNASCHLCYFAPLRTWPIWCWSSLTNSMSFLSLRVALTILGSPSRAPQSSGAGMRAFRWAYSH